MSVDDILYRGFTPDTASPLFGARAFLKGVFSKRVVMVSDVLAVNWRQP